MRIGVVGDFMQDAWYVADRYCSNSEGPAPTYKIAHTHRMAGGAGNVAANLEALGASVDWMYFGETFGPIKNRLIYNNQIVSRWDVNDRCMEYATGLEHGWKQINQPYDALVISDYLKGSITEEWIHRELTKVDCPVFVDTKRDPRSYNGFATALFPNNSEYLKYKREYDTMKLVVHTKGQDGLELLKYGEPRYAVKGFDVDEVCVVGAGDSVVSAFVWKYMQCRCEKKAARYANAAGAVAVSKPFTSTVTVGEIESLIALQGDKIL